MNQDLKQLAQLHDENIELKKEIERLKAEREWISVNDRLPESCSIVDKVLLFMLVNESQSALSITVFDANMVKYCSPSESWWMPLPEPPKQ